MGESRSILLIFIILLFPGWSAKDAFSQGDQLNSYEFLSPLPFSLYNNPEESIIIRFGEKIDITSIQDELLEVSGNLSGKHAGKFTVSKDQLTLIFKPVQAFLYDEKVNLHLMSGIKTLSSNDLPEFDYFFSIRQRGDSYLSQVVSDYSNKYGNFREPFETNESIKGSTLSFLDFRIPEITLNIQPDSGNILTTLVRDATNYLYVFDNNANPVFTRLMPHSVSNLKQQPGDMLTYYDNFLRGYVELDSSLAVVDTITMKNGYKTDAHELLQLKNGNVFMISYDPRIVDMSKIVPGGNPFATVSGLIIQELDSDKNLIFQWRSWDYFNIEDSYADLLSSVVDYVHGNSLDIDTDTTLILSSRNLNEITRISLSTGKIIWRLGGRKNEFAFENDPRGFSGQHSALKQKNGTLTLFDNGVNFNPLYSRGIEYEIDEINKKVKLMHEYRHSPDVYANVSGNLQRLENGNTFIFFGPAIDHSEQFISEFDAQGNPNFEAKFGANIYPNYRAYRSTWEPKLFTFSTDTLQVKGTLQNTTLYRTFGIKNNSNKTIIITSAHHKNIGFYPINLPVTIDATSEAIVTVAFPSYISGKFSDKIIFCLETDSSIVTRSLYVSVDNIPTTGIEDQYLTSYNVKPNPSKAEFYVEVTSTKRFLLRLIDMSGRKVWEAVGAGSEAYQIDLSNKPDGMYLLYLEESSSGRIHTLKLIKQK